MQETELSRAAQALQVADFVRRSTSQQPDVRPAAEAVPVWEWEAANQRKMDAV